MAYDKADILEQALKAISEHRLTFFDEISLHVEPTRATLYEWGFDKLDAIKEALKTNRISRKVKMRKKWEESENATLQIAAYKLIAEQEELDILNTSKVQNEHSGKVETENKSTISLADLPDEIARQVYAFRTK